MPTDPATDVALSLWNALYERRWDDVRALFDERSHYEDIPAPDLGARGPDAIVRRLRIGFDPVESHEHEIRNVVSDGRTVMIEHTETWHWRTGETARLPFVSVLETDPDAGVILRWSDYWNYDSLLGSAPAWWVEHIMAEYAANPFDA